MAAVGADEAGKGPVLGSMFAAAVRVPDGTDLPADLDDSKRLPAERRAAIDERLRATDGVAVAVAEMPVDRIDDPATDMNGLAVTAQAEALSTVVEAGDTVRCDAADVDPERFGRRVAEAVADRRAGRPAVQAAHRADERYAVVSAASVVAKVARDAHVEALAATYGELGSGYPSDPATKQFLADYVRDHGRLPDCARASWATSERVLAAAEQAELDGF